jgi:hypothetical protein
MLIHARKMGDINKKIQELQVDGNNYLSWAMDMKINLTSRNLDPTITTPLKMLQKCSRNTHVNTCRKNG